MDSGLTCDSAFDWKSLSADEVVVDVGGSVGSVTHAILQENPHLRYVVQDLATVINTDAKTVRVSVV